MLGKHAVTTVLLSNSRFWLIFLGCPVINDFPTFFDSLKEDNSLSQLTLTTPSKRELQRGSFFYRKSCFVQLNIFITILIPHLQTVFPSKLFLCSIFSYVLQISPHPWGGWHFPKEMTGGVPPLFPLIAVYSVVNECPCCHKYLLLPQYVLKHVI